ncbi:MAG: hypothetical protein ABI639_03750 [Thermoanaerobaculia bacterium]
MCPQEKFPTALSSSLRAGALYDALVALLLVLMPAATGALLGLPLPGERFYLWLIAFFLLTLAAFYVLVAQDPANRRPFVHLAIATRLLGGSVIAAAALGRPDLRGLFVIAGGDWLFGALHLVFLPRGGRPAPGRRPLP